MKKSIFIFIFVMFVILYSVSAVNFKTRFNSFTRARDYYLNYDNLSANLTADYIFGIQNWSHINYPSACQSGSAITELGDSIVCTSIMRVVNDSGYIFNNLTGGNVENNLTVSGSVGIGTSTPSEELEINGDTMISDNDKHYLGDAKDIAIYFNGSNLVFNGEIGTPNVIFSGVNNVGIGTTIPLDDLEVVDSGTNQDAYIGVTTYNDQTGISSQVNFRKSHTDTPLTYASTLDTEVLGEIKAYGVNSYPNNWALGSRIKFVQNGNAGVSAIPTDIIFQTSPGISVAPLDRMTIANTGFVGIGTTEPESLLDVAGEGVTTLGARRASDDIYTAACLIKKSRGTLASKSPIQNGDFCGSFGFQGWTGSNWLIAAGVTGQIDGTVSGLALPGALTFRTNPGDILSVERMRITPSGNVGIGTKTPKAKLHLNGSGILLNVSNSTDSFLYIDESNKGNVGIGTTAPAHKLELAGSGNVSGDWNVSGNLIGNSIIAHIFATNNSIETTISAAEKWENITTLWAGRLNGFTFSNGKLTAQVPGWYSEVTNFCTTIDGSNDRISSRIVVNNERINQTMGTRKQAAADVGYMGITPGLFYLNSGDYINYQIRNLDSTANILLCNFGSLIRHEGFG